MAGRAARRQQQHGETIPCEAEIDSKHRGIKFARSAAQSTLDLNARKKAVDSRENCRPASAIDVQRDPCGGRLQAGPPARRLVNEREKEKPESARPAG